MPATRLAAAVIAVAIGAGAITTAHTAMAASSRAALGCCMIRADAKSEWLRSDHSFKNCKEENAEKDGKRDKLFRKTGRVWWNIRC